MEYKTKSGHEEPSQPKPQSWVHCWDELVQKATTVRSQQGVHKVGDVCSDGEEAVQCRCAAARAVVRTQIVRTEVSGQTSWGVKAIGTRGFAEDCVVWECREKAVKCLGNQVLP